MTFLLVLLVLSTVVGGLLYVSRNADEEGRKYDEALEAQAAGVTYDEEVDYTILMDE